MDDPSTQASEGFGLMYYGARWYDASLGRFAQPDSIVPTGTQGTQAWDRYAYVNGNPVKYGDPTGHQACAEISGNQDCYSEKDIANGKREADNKQGYSQPVCMDPNAANYRTVGFCVAKQIPGLVNYGSSSVSGGDAAAFTIQTLLRMLDAIAATNIGDLLKKGLSLSKALDLVMLAKMVKTVNPNAYVDGIIGGGLQLLSDLDRTDLDPLQIAGRVLISGLETTGTGLIANGAAVLAAAALVGTGPIGAGAGFFAGQIGVTLITDELILPAVNGWLFPSLRLGDY